MKLWGFEGHPWTYDATGASVGLCNSRIRQIEERIVKRTNDASAWAARLSLALEGRTVKEALALPCLHGLGKASLWGLARALRIAHDDLTAPPKAPRLRRVDMEAAILKEIMTHPLGATEISHRLGRGRGSCARTLGKLVSEGRAFKSGTRYGATRLPRKAA